MKLKQFFTDDDAVSPVIGVILMVAITVILAAVIASFVLGLGQSAGNNAPQASFEWDYDESPNELTITLQNNELDPEEISVKGDPGDGSSAEVLWSDVAGSTSDISAGSSITITTSEMSGLSSKFDLRIVWEPSEGGDSAVLNSETGPDA